MNKEFYLEKLASTKPVYRVRNISDLDPNLDDEAWSAKIDGAHTLIRLEAGKKAKLFSHRTSKKTGELIEYTPKLPHVQTPSEFNAVVRGETYATKNGFAVHPDVVTAMLNSGLDKSLELQKKLGIKTCTALIDVDSFEGRDLRHASYDEKRKVLEKIAEGNPDFHFADTAYTPAEKKLLLEKVVKKTHPQTSEGIVVHNRFKSDKFTKAKVIDHHDVYITSIFPEEGVKAGRKPMAGGFTYAWSKGGRPVGKVGTGFSHSMKVHMLAHPEEYVGKVAKCKALDLSKNKVLVKPSFDGFHIEKNLE